MAGRFAPGDHLEPVQIGEELHSSITPVRDALHRLVGERLVEAPRNDGFRAPVVTELGLRQLYGWQVDLVRLAAGRLRPERIAIEQTPQPDGPLASPAAIFLVIGRAAGDQELLQALANACERLAPVGLLEARIITGLDIELDSLRQALDDMERPALRAALKAYNRRRDRAVPQIVDALQRAF